MPQRDTENKTGRGVAVAPLHPGSNQLNVWAGERSFPAAAKARLQFHGSGHSPDELKQFASCFRKADKATVGLQRPIAYKNQMNIRPEQSGDEPAIYELTLKAFEPMSYSDGTEAPIIGQLRKDGDLTISLVATKESVIVGHIAFSPVTIGGEHGGWYGLGPVSVRPDLQKSGIGSKLINEGLSQLKELGAVGCALIGNPDFYSRFGFRSDGNLIYANVPIQYVQWLSFGAHSAAGVLKFAPAFEH